jgi:hypothetical protein
MDPKELNSVSDPDKVNRVELIFEVLFTVLGLILFNFYPDFPSLNGSAVINGLFVLDFQRLFSNICPGLIFCSSCKS